MGETYTVVDATPVRGRVLLKRASDGKVARCKLSWLEPVSGQTCYQAKSKTKSIRLDGLEWEVEG